MRLRLCGAFHLEPLSGSQCQFWCFRRCLHWCFDFCLFLYRHTKGLDFREAFQEPALDDGIAETLAMAFGNQLLLIIDGLLLVIIVGSDVLFHVSVVQTGVDVLGFLGLANSYLVTGVVAAGFLEHLVLIRTEDGGLGGEALVRTREWVRAETVIVVM